MSERQRFNVIEASSNEGASTISLEVNKREEVPFTDGEIVYATTDLGEKVVIKKTLRKDQARHEWKGLGIAHSTGIFVPTPIALIKYNENNLAIVCQHIEGINLFFQPNPSIKPEIGRQIKKMHQRAQVNGELWESSGRNTFVYYDKYVFNWTRSQIEELRADSKTTTMLSQLRDVMEQFCRHSEPTFNHNDLHDGQVIVNTNNRPTIIDFGNWVEETWLNDIGYHLFHLIRTNRADTEDFSNFLDGYNNGEALSDEEKSNLMFYLLFISSRAITYFHRRRSSYLPTAKQTHDKVLSYLDEETAWKKF